jgi:hypothetical protein
MEQIPSYKANSRSASQEIPCLIWNPKVHYVHKNGPLVPILSQMYPVHTLQLISLRSNLILSSHLQLDFLSSFFPSGPPTKILCAFRISPVRATRPDHIIIPDILST